MKKIAVVTGASSGIGRACAHALLNDGWQTVMVARRPELLDKAVIDAGDAGKNATAISADLSSEHGAEKVFTEVEKRFGRVDLLFNNAGVSLPYTLPSEVAIADWKRVVDINLNGAFYCLAAAFRLMKSQSPQGGRIINNGSISAHVPRPGSIAYAATKHAVSGLTKAAALDGRAFNIAVGQIDIGNVTSDMTAAMSSGVRQADGSLKPEACMDMSAVVDTFMAMVNLPLNANILCTTVMATQMPYVGRG